MRTVTLALLSVLLAAAALLLTWTLLDPRDDAFTLCPFYAFDPSSGLFGCDIHGIKSGTCKAFMCEGSERLQ